MARGSSLLSSLLSSALSSLLSSLPSLSALLSLSLSPPPSHSQPSSLPLLLHVRFAFVLPPFPLVVVGSSRSCGGSGGSAAIAAARSGGSAAAVEEEEEEVEEEEEEEGRGSGREEGERRPRAERTASFRAMFASRCASYGDAIFWFEKCAPFSSLRAAWRGSVGRARYAPLHIGRAT